MTDIRSSVTRPDTSLLEAIELCAPFDYFLETNTAPFVALALCANCDGIWSNDRDLKEQHLTKVWNAAEIVKSRVRKRASSDLHQFGVQDWHFVN